MKYMVESCIDIEDDIYLIAILVSEDVDSIEETSMGYGVIFFFFFLSTGLRVPMACT